MSSIHETAYPRFKSEITPRELTNVYTPSQEEQAFARRQGRTLQGRLAVLVLVKTAQRLGYFVKLAEAPPSIVAHIATGLATRSLTKIEMRDFDLDSERQRLLEQVRRFLGIQAVTGATTGVIESAAREAAQTKHEMADIINVVIEQLVRQRFELPGFSTLLRTARRIRAQVNDASFSLLSAALSPALKHEIDDLFLVNAGITSGWLKLKREPKKPTNPEVRTYLEHLAWLKAWVARLPAIDHIAAPKFHQYVLEARALDAASIKATKPAKRYALAVVLIHAQLHQALDDAVDILRRKVRKLHATGAEQLDRYFTEHRLRAEKLIATLRDVLKAFMYIALFSHFIPCGVYEAVYILDGLIKNESDVQPDTVHGDTHAQSTPAFGLAYLLGIRLMPRIRQLKKLVFFRPAKQARYRHIDALFSESIDWSLISTHLPDMLRVALSIKAGKIGRAHV